MHSFKLKLTIALFCLVVLPLSTLPSCQSSGETRTPVQGWWAARGPVIPHDSFPTDCSLCHKGGSWNELVDDFTFDHEAETGVALVGAHDTAECLRCHNDRGPVARFADRGCAGCHEDVHQGDLGQNCSDCHEPRTWQPVELIAKHAGTRFPLIGAHAAVGCWQCHAGSAVGNFSGTSVECATCHGAALAATSAPGSSAPDHQVQGWTQSCDECHIPTTWSGGGFNHAAFPLTGAHAPLDCSACHSGGGFTGVPSDCLSCHTPEYNAAPAHVAQSFPTDCAACHSTSAWTGATFDHAAVGITSGCVDCHLGDFTATTAPNHMAAGFPTSCESCHGTNTWNGASFNHSFPINSGDHKDLDCTDCHTNQSSFAVFSCVTCHTHSQSEMADEHDRVPGYVWSSPACLSCHMNGRR